MVVLRRRRGRQGLAHRSTATGYLMSSRPSEKIHPLAHAAGGSIGSALALLLLYPLERSKSESALERTPSAPRRYSHRIFLVLFFPSSTARIEVQKTVALKQAILSDKDEGQIGSATDAVQGHSLSLNSNDGGSADEDSTESFHDVQETILSDEEDDTLLEDETTSSLHHDQIPEKLPEECNSELLACFRRVWECGELYKGAGPLAWTLATSNFVFFFVNAFLKGKLAARSRSKSLPSTLSLLASCLAGSVNVLLTNPLWVTNLRIINGASKHDNLWKELIHVAQTLGPRHLWQGTTASLLLVSNPVIQFFCYEQIKSLQLGRRRSTPPKERERFLTLTPAEAFFFAAFAKAIATVATYPLQLAQAVLRMQKKTVPLDATTTSGGTTSTKEVRKIEGTFECILSIFERDGFRGLFTGLRAKMLQSVLTAAFTFLTYEQILGAVSAFHRKLLTAKGSTI